MSSFNRITEQSSPYDNIEEMSLSTLLDTINQEDHIVPYAVKLAIPQIEAVIQRIVLKLKQGGRLFYIGAGTSGRLGVLDASECPPTFGVSYNTVIGIIAGGDHALRKAVENAEDNPKQGWRDLEAYQINSNDFVIGIAASGSTPYVVNALLKCKHENIETAGISCNPNSPLSQVAQTAIEIIVGPEFITGSSRMKAGTAQKLVLNMISTATMIQLGRIKGNRMIDMKISNTKLFERGCQILIDELGIDHQQATDLLKEHQQVRTAIKFYNQSKNGKNK